MKKFVRVSQKTGKREKTMDIFKNSVYNTTHTADSCGIALSSKSCYLRSKNHFDPSILSKLQDRSEYFQTKNQEKGGLHCMVKI